MKGLASASNVRGLVGLAQRRLTGEPPKRNAASLESVERGYSRRQRRRRALLATAATAILGVTCALRLLLAQRGETLRVEVVSGSARLNGPRGCSLLRFSDGSQVAIGAGALLRIAALDSRGAQLELERGSARVDVASRAGALWRLSAGEYRMDGNGTSFDVDFDPARQRLSLDLESGSLFVDGPAFRAELDAGELLSIDLEQGRVSLERRGLIARCSPGDAEAERKDQ